jgi:hypothetical protein
MKTANKSKVGCAIMAERFNEQLSTQSTTAS